MRSYNIINHEAAGANPVMTSKFPHLLQKDPQPKTRTYLARSTFANEGSTIFPSRNQPNREKFENVKKVASEHKTFNPMFTSTKNWQETDQTLYNRNHYKPRS